MAQRKAGGSSRNGRDSESSALLKKFGGEAYSRQHHRAPARPRSGHAGVNVGLGKDHTIFAAYDGQRGLRKKATAESTCCNAESRAANKPVSALKQPASIDPADAPARFQSRLQRGDGAIPNSPFRMWEERTCNRARQEDQSGLPNKG
ncbi:hypothetical protein F2981_04845 [Sinorhizobium meliloti]|nr:hypothetical protein [Sinorhizobium meliloti]